jgi:hypothetical protein
VVTATAAQRVAAIDKYRLPPCRVIQMDVLRSESELSQVEDRIGAGFATMAGIGPMEPHLSSAGVSIARLIVRALGAGRNGALAQSAANSQDVGDADGTAWPASAAAWTSGPESQLQKHVAPPVIVGAQLDERLQGVTRKRARRFARQRVQWERRADGGSS